MLVGGAAIDFYGQKVEDIVNELEKNVSMTAGVTTLSDVSSNNELLKAVMSNDGALKTLLSDQYRGITKANSGILKAMKNTAAYGKKALTIIAANPTLKSEFIAISGAYSDTSDFRYLLTCERCQNKGTITYQPDACGSCGGAGWTRYYGSYSVGENVFWICTVCGQGSNANPEWDKCSCSEYTVHMNTREMWKLCTACNSNYSKNLGAAGTYTPTMTTVSCPSCGGTCRHF